MLPAGSFPPACNGLGFEHAPLFDSFRVGVYAEICAPPFNTVGMIWRSDDGASASLFGSSDAEGEHLAVLFLTKGYDPWACPALLAGGLSQPCC